MRKLILGIDTGGTHTDAVVFDPSTKSVLALAKAATTHHDLSRGISQVLSELSLQKWPGGFPAVDRIHLSTTLATNSIAEGLSSRVGLVMIGYDENQEAVRELVANLPLAVPIFAAGGHDFYGRESAPFEDESFLERIHQVEGQVTSWAVSSLFSIKNPGHEIRAADLIKTVSAKPVTLGRDLTGQLDVVRRAATAALNAGLVVILQKLLDAVKFSAGQVGLGAARLLVVKGDGSLVSEAWAREKPIETVVSGPAASLVGAKVLAQGFLTPEERDIWVVDVGGTTTDLGLIKDGLPEVTADGATVGPWKTMTVAVENRTTALGGDSLVQIDQGGELTLGPRRVVPLCRLALEHPQILKTLEAQKYNRLPPGKGGCFILPEAEPSLGMNPIEQHICQIMAQEKRPLEMPGLCKSVPGLSGLESLRGSCIPLAAFTPTDAMAILGFYKAGQREAAVLGAELLGLKRNLSAPQVATLVLEEFARLMAEEIISCSLNQEGLRVGPSDFRSQGLLGQALGRRGKGNMEITVRSRNTVALLGAPVNVLLPFLGRYLSGRIVVPPSFEAASAVGAAAAPIYLKRQVEIHRSPEFSGYRLFLPDKMVDGDSVDQLVEVATLEMEQYMRNLAQLAGANRAKVTLTRQDRTLTQDEETLCLGSVLTFVVKDELKL